MPRKFYQKWLSCCKILKRLLFPPKAATVKIECFNPYLKTSLIRLRMKRSLQSLISFFSGLGQIFVFCSRSQETYLLLRQKEQIGSSFENFFPCSWYYFSWHWGVATFSKSIFFSQNSSLISSYFLINST